MTTTGGFADDNSFPVVDVPATVTNRDDVVQLLLAEMAKLGQFSADHVEPLLAGIVARERLGSTGIGRHIAMPHTVSPLVDRMCVIIGRLATPVDWLSLDGQRVTRVVCSIRNPSMHREAMKLVEELSRRLGGDDLL
jgi:mannitol/fructose-specific phosphotransferase system IIA component (Ntr-type)